MASRAEGRVFKFRPSPLSFSKVMCEITFEIYHEFNGKGKSRGTLQPAKLFNGVCEVHNPHKQMYTGKLIPFRDLYVHPHTSDLHTYIS